MNNLKLAATTGFLDRIDIENETVWLGGWFLSFESEPVEKLKIYIGNTELTDFEITRNLPSPGVKKVHPNIPAADRCRFLIKLHLPPSQQQQFRDALISLIPIIQGREGEPLLTAVNPSLSRLLKKSEPEEVDSKQDADSTPEVELIYVHVPKAAGTAFRKILQQVYGPEKVLTDTTNMFEDNMPPTIDRQTKVIDGHFRAGKYDQLFPNCKTITWLRQPIHRSISDYCFRQMGSLKEKDFLSKERLLEFARIPGNRNLISYCLNGKPLSYFHFVGILEYFEEDLADLRNLMGWKEVKSVYQNRNPYPEYNEFKKAVLADKELMAELTALNSQDVGLYQSAWKLRDQRKKGLISLPETPPPGGTEARTGKMPVLRSGETEEKSVAAEPVPTLGSIDKVAVSDGLLEITGWTFSRQAGLPGGFKLSLGGLEVANLQQKLGLPSPDVKKIHPKFPTAAKARFQLRASLSKVPAGETEVTLTPMFKGRQGQRMVKGLSLGGAPIATKTGKIAEAITTNQKTGKIAEAITTNQKTGKIAEAITTNQKIGKIAEAITTNPA
ncbi:MAG: sulfotransferase family 2 domain-containing protein, partial [Cyanobacteriota bacterium]|nr:sulfotransferase family 2 domain-containing protein [Cyanobacteriota bacterium]